MAIICDIRVTISAGGTSAVMAKALRARIEKLITKEDLLHIKLQEYMRGILKQRIINQKDRKKILYKILEDEQVEKSLKDGKFGAAQKTAMKIMESFEKEAE